MKKMREDIQRLVVRNQMKKEMHSLGFSEVPQSLPLKVRTKNQHTLKHIRNQKIIKYF